MRAIALFLVVLLNLPIASSSASPVTLFGRVARYVQPLYKDAAGTDALCTVVLVEHYWVSASHCFKTDEGYISRYLRGGKRVGPNAVVIYDLVVLPGRAVARGLQLTNHQPPPGTHIWAFGYAFGGKQPMLTMTEGAIVGYPAVTPHFNIRMQRYAGQVIGGMSGGPVVTRDGKMFTMVAFGRRSGPAEILYSLPLSVFQEALSAS